MKTAGWIFIAIGTISGLGNLIGGNGIFGALFFIAIGIALIHFGKQKEMAKNQQEQEKGSVLPAQSTEQTSKDALLKEPTSEINKQYQETDHA